MVSVSAAALTIAVCAATELGAGVRLTAQVGAAPVAVALPSPEAVELGDEREQSVRCGVDVGGERRDLVSDGVHVVRIDGGPVLRRLLPNPRPSSVVRAVTHRSPPIPL